MPSYFPSSPLPLLRSPLYPQCYLCKLPPLQSRVSVTLCYIHNSLDFSQMNSRRNPFQGGGPSDLWVPTSQSDLSELLPSVCCITEADGGQSRDCLSVSLCRLNNLHTQRSLSERLSLQPSVLHSDCSQSRALAYACDYF